MHIPQEHMAPPLYMCHIAHRHLSTLLLLGGMGMDVVIEGIGNTKLI
jgi:hypothetical protein